MMKRLLFCFLMVYLVVSCGPDLDLVQTVLLPPSQVQLVFPEANEECTTGTIISDTESEVEFDWTDADIVDRYRITLINLTTNQEQTFETENSSLPIILLRGTPYQWRVDSILNDSETITPSDTEVFYNAGPGVQSFIPFPATAIFPKNNELINPGSITLEWEASDLDNDIREYNIYFGTEEEPPLFSEAISTNSLTNIEVNAGQQYYWKVITIDSQGNESISQVFSFEVAN